MASLPTISGREARDVFLKDGWTFARQRGSHMILYHKELAKGTIRGLLRSAGMTTERFIELLG